MLEGPLSARRFVIHLDNFDPAIDIRFEGVGPEGRADVRPRTGRELNLLRHVEQPIVQLSLMQRCQAYRRYEVRVYIPHWR